MAGTPLQGAVLLALGSYRFSVATGGFYESQRETSWRWASQEVIGAAPRKQYVGPGDDTLTLQGTIFPQYRGGIGQVDLMRTQAGLGQPLPLMTGWGAFLGNYVITHISEIRTVFTSDGAPKKIDFVIGLERYA